jgi:hypothetical protein
MGKVYGKKKKGARGKAKGKTGIERPSFSRWLLRI